MEALLIKNIAALVTGGEAGVLKNVDMLCRDGAVEAVGKGLEAPSARVINAEAMLCYPGLVNTHHHLYQYFTRNMPGVQSLELFGWLRALYGVWAGLDEETVYYSSALAMAELLRHGCTTVFDHHYVFPKGSGGLTAAQFAAAEALGVRFHASRGSMDLSVKDGGLPPDSVVQTVDEILDDCRRTVEKFHDPSRLSMRRVALAPCSPFSVSGALLRESAALARSLGVRLHTHLCETLDEEEYTLSRFGLRPLDYMESLGWLGGDVWFAHGIHFTREELARLAQSGTGVAHCPASNMKLSSGTANVPEMLALGVPVGLAVDGSASNDGSNMLEEMRICYLLHRLTRGAAAPSGGEILKMACSGGARLLGREDIGVLAPGMAADFFLVDSRRSELAAACADPEALLCTVGLDGPVDYTVVNGVVAVEQGRLALTDQEELARKGAAAAERYLKKAL